MKLTEAMAVTLAWLYREHKERSPFGLWSDVVSIPNLHHSTRRGLLKRGLIEVVGPGMFKTETRTRYLRVKLTAEGRQLVEQRRLGWGVDLDA